MEFNRACQILNIDENDINVWYKGLKKPNKNKYFKVNDIMVVELSQDKYMFIDNNRRARDILRQHIFRTDKYPLTDIVNIINGRSKRTTIRYHQLFMDYDWTKNDCDHINRNGFDNRDDNLRIVTHSENMRNITIQCNNTSGNTGVYYHKKHNTWYASIFNNNKRITKCFSCNKFDNAKELAIEWRKNKENDYGYIGE